MHLSDIFLSSQETQQTGLVPARRIGCCTTGLPGLKCTFAQLLTQPLKIIPFKKQDGLSLPFGISFLPHWNLKMSLLTCFNRIFPTSYRSLTFLNIFNNKDSLKKQNGSWHYYSISRWLSFYSLSQLWLFAIPWTWLTSLREISGQGY